MSNLEGMSLLEVTGQESGIIIYNDSEILIVNWSDCDDYEIPLVFFGGTVKYPHKPWRVSETKHVSDIRELLPTSGEIVYDANNDMPGILSGEPKTSGTQFTLYCQDEDEGDGMIVVIAPDGWN